MRGLVIQMFFLVFCSNVSLAQNTYSKVYDIDSTALWNFMIELEFIDGYLYTHSFQFTDADSIYLQTAVLTKHNLNKDIIGSVYNMNVNVGTDNAQCVTHNDNAIYYTTRPLDGQRTEIYSYDLDLNIIDTFIYQGTPSGSITFRHGVNYVDDNFYIFGYVNNGAEFNDSIQIIKADQKGRELWRKYYEFGSAGIRVNNLQKTPDGHIAFIADRISPAGPGGVEGYLIAKIDTTGEILDSISFQGLEGQPNRLLVTSEGNYVFGSDGHPFKGDPFVEYQYGLINKLDAGLDSLEWTYILPNDQLINNRQYQVYDYIEAANGDILACGQVFDNSDTEEPTGIPDYNSTHNGFIVRLTPEGEQVWLHIYKTNNDLVPHDPYGKFRPSICRKILELPDGRIIAAGSVGVTVWQNNVIDEDTTEIYDLWLLMVDENGCLEGEECDEIIRIDGKKRYRDGYLPIIDHDQVWIGNETSGETKNSFQYIYKRDSIWNESNYYYARMQSDQEDGSDPYLEGYYKEIFGKLKLKREGTFNERVLLDMSLEKDDVFKATKDSTIIKYIVNEVDTVRYEDNIPRKRIQLSCLDDTDNSTLTWIEGIGEIDSAPYCSDAEPSSWIRCVLNKVGERAYSTINEDEDCWIKTSTRDIELHQFHLFPNPVYDKLKIYGGSGDYEVFSIHGLLMGLRAETQELDVSSLKAGVYLLRDITTGKSLKFLKI